MKRLEDQVAIVTGAAGDVGDAASAAASVRFAEERFGRLHILVNNAATSSPYVPVPELDEANWRRALDVNLTGAFAQAWPNKPIRLIIP